MIGDLNDDGGATWRYGGLGLAMTGFGDFIFQAMFAATGATIVSGAVAERVKLSSFMVFALLFVGVAYPCLLYTSPSPRDRQKSRMPSSA